MAKSLRPLRSRPVNPAGVSRAPLLVAALLAFATTASAGIWALQLLARPDPVPRGAVQAGRLDAATLAEAAPMLFGAAAPAPAPAAAAAVSRFTLLGVIGGGDKAGAALIGISGKSPRAVAVGGEVEPGVTLLDTAFDRALLRERGARVALRMARQPRAETAAIQSVPAAVAPPLAVGGQPPVLQEEGPR